MGVGIGWYWLRYPCRTASLEMMTSTEYAQIDIDRENGVEAHTILAANQTYSKFAGISGAA